jgi:putative endonuclease
VKKILGKKGEDTAAQFLEGKGYEIVARNYHVKRQEIDIVAKEKETYVFVEVKSRSSSDFGFPEDFVSAQQEGRIRNAATHFLVEQNITAKHIRFDVVSVLVSENNMEIEHFEDAF